MSDIFPALRKAPILSGLSEAHLTGLLKHLKCRSLEEGEALFREGWRGDYMGVVAAGSFEVTISTKGGGETSVGEIGPGDVVGEMACVDPAPRSATVTAVRPAVVYCLSRPMLLALRDKGPAVAMAIVSGVIAQVTDRIRKSNEQFEERMKTVRGGQPPARNPADTTRAAFGVAGARPPQPHRDPVDLSGVKDMGTLTPADLEVMATVARRLRYEPGALLCAEGEAGNSCFVVVEGEVEVVKLVGDEPRILTTLSGCLLGQIALVDPGPRSATLRARGPVNVLELGRDTFEQLLGEHSPFAMRFQDMLAVTGIRQLRESTTRLAGIPESSAVVPPPAAPPIRERPPVRVETEAPRPRLKKRRTPSGGHPVPGAMEASTESEALSLTLAYMQASLKEWGMSMDDLDGVRVERCEGVMSAAERRSRLDH